MICVANLYMSFLIVSLLVAGFYFGTWYNSQTIAEEEE